MRERCLEIDNINRWKNRNGVITSHRPFYPMDTEGNRPV